MRFHVVGLPHTNTTLDFTSCAFTEKVRRFCIMMKSLNHTVFLYAGELSSVKVDEHIPCITERMRLESLKGKHYTAGEFDDTLDHWVCFNTTAIKEMRKRIQKKDFICLIGGICHKSIADAFPSHMTVEFGIGYPGTFARYRVFESYAWMHSLYSQHRSAGSVDGNFFDAVIPGYFEPEMFPFVEKKADYYLFIGRLVDRKGYRIAQEVCQKLGKRLVLAGVGDQSGYGEFVGVVGPEKRAELMGHAIAVFVPTLYIEPFGNVVVEAELCGTPVITTDWGAFTETNINGLTGYRCRTFSEFCKAAEDVTTLDYKKIREFAIGKFSLEVVCKEYEKYFKRLETLWGKGWYETNSV